MRLGSQGLFSLRAFAVQSMVSDCVSFYSQNRASKRVFRINDYSVKWTKDFPFVVNV